MHASYCLCQFDVIYKRACLFIQYYERCCESSISTCIPFPPVYIVMSCKNNLEIFMLFTIAY